MGAPRTPSAKTAFGQLLVSKIEESGRTVTEVSAKLKNTPASQFTRWKKGLWTYIPPEKLVAIIAEVAKDPEDQTDLILAYLYDMTPVRYRPMIVVGAKGDLPTSITDGEAPWMRPMRKRLDLIADAYAKNPEFASLVDHLTEWAKRLTK